MTNRRSWSFHLILGLSVLLSVLLTACPNDPVSSATQQKSQELAKLEKDRAKLSLFIEKGRANPDKKYRTKYKQLLGKYKQLVASSPEVTRYRYLYGFILVNHKSKWRQFDQCLRNDPEHYWCLIGRGKIYVRWKVRDKALIDFQKARTIRPSRMEPLIGLASIAMSKRQDAKAIGLYKQVLAKQASNRDALWGMAVLHERKGDNTSALSYYEKLLQVEPKHFEALRSAGNLYFKLKRIDNAASAYERAIQERPRSFRLLVKLATIYETQLKRPTKALQLFEKASKLPQSHFYTYYRLGVLRGKAGKVKGGISALKQALRQTPQHPGALFALGQLYLRNNDATKAAPILWKALRLNGGKVEVRIELAKALTGTKDYAGVLRQYEEILKLDANRSDVKQSMNALLQKIGLNNKGFTGRTPKGVFDSGKRRVYRCYKNRLKEKPKLKGNVNIKLLISPAGAVERVSILVEKTTLEDKIVQACVKWTYRRATFPRLRRQRPYTIKGLLEFRP